MVEETKATAASRPRSRAAARSRSKSPGRATPAARSKSAGVVLAPLGSPEERVEQTRALYLSAGSLGASGAAAAAAAAASAAVDASTFRSELLCKNAARPTRRRNETLAADLDRRIDQLLKLARRWAASAANASEAIGPVSPGGGGGASGAAMMMSIGSVESGPGLGVAKKRRPRPPFDYAGAVLKLSHDFDSRVQEPTVHRFLSSLLALIRGKPLGKRDIAHLRSDLVILGVQAPRAEIFAGLQQLHKDAMVNKASEAARALRMLASLVLKSTLIASATKVQAVARGHMQRALLVRQQREKEEARAATTVQAAARGKLVRKANRNRTIAAQKVQAVTRGHAVRKEQARQHGAATKVQALARGQRDRKEIKRRHKAATQVQAMARARHERRVLQKKKEAATKAQALARGRIIRSELAAKRRCVTQVQAVVRGHHAREERKAQTMAAVKVQALARGRQQRKRVLSRSQSAVQIQAVTRGHLARVSQSARNLAQSAEILEGLEDHVDEMFEAMASDANAAICMSENSDDKMALTEKDAEADEAIKEVEVVEEGKIEHEASQEHNEASQEPDKASQEPDRASQEPETAKSPIDEKSNDVAVESKKADRGKTEALESCEVTERDRNENPEDHDSSSEKEEDKLNADALGTSTEFEEKKSPTDEKPDDGN